MKRTTKTFAIMAALAVFTTTGLFAQNQNYQNPEIQVPTEFENVQTIAVSVKVVTKKEVSTIYLKLKNGKTYIADALGPAGDEAVQVLLRRNGKKAVVSGVLNESTGVFNIIKIGSLNTIIGGDEK